MQLPMRSPRQDGRPEGGGQCSVTYGFADPRRCRLASVCLALLPLLGSAQIIRDGTLGPDATVQSVGPVHEILESHGELRGNNLFHSFSDFNIQANESATFSGRESIENIVSRVTGANRSLIDGPLTSTVPEADVYLLNPNGILFGPNASIDIDGAFNASTSESLEFSTGEVFETRTGAPVPALTVAAPVRFGFLGEGAGPIVIEGSVLETSGGVNLNAQNIDINAAIVSVPATQSRPASGIVISAAEQVTLSGTRPLDATRGPGLGSRLEAFAASAGDAGGIRIEAPVVSLEDGANLVSLTEGASAGGNIAVLATKHARFSGTDASSGSGTTLYTHTSSDGNAGSIAIDAPVVGLEDGSVFLTSSSGQGSSGDIAIGAAQRISLSGVNATEATYPSALQITSSFDGTKAGSINLDAPVIKLQDGARLSTQAGGSIDLSASERITLSGVHQRSNTGTKLWVATASETDGGSIALEAPVVEFDARARLLTETFAGGQGGHIELTASDGISLTGPRLDGDEDALMTLTTSHANGGAITLDTREVRVGDGAFFTTHTTGTGAGGDISIHATDSVTFSGTNQRGGGSTLSTHAFSDGNAGSIAVDAVAVDLDAAVFSTGSSSGGSSGDIAITAGQRISLSGVNATADTYPSALEIGSSLDGTKAGSLSLDAPVIELQDGARLSTRAGGSIGLTASDRITLSGVHQRSNTGTKLSVATASETDGGNIVLAAPVLEFDGRTRLLTETLAGGQGGHIELTASDSITFTGPRLEGDEDALKTMTSSHANAGAITLDTRALRVEDGAFFTTHTTGTGAGGDISIHATDRVAFSGTNQRGGGSTLQASTAGAGNTGSITVGAPVVYLSDGAVFFTAPSRDATGSTGSITVSASERLTLTGVNRTGDTFPSALQTTASRQGGSAGPIIVNAAVIGLEDGARFLASTLGPGAGGAISVTAADRFTLSGVHQKSDLPSTVSTNTFNQGDAGGIAIEAPEVQLEDGGIVSAETFGSGAGGEMSIVAGDTLRLSDDASLTSRSTGSGNAGAIDVTAGNAIHLVGSEITTEAEHAAGGNIAIRADSMLSLQDSEISTSAATGEGQGGNISIDPEFVVLNRSAIIARADAGRGGNITLVADHFLASPDSIIDASANTGIDGEVRIDSPEVNEQSGEETLETAFLDVASLLGPECGAAAGAGQGSFRVAHSAGAPASPEEALAAFDTFAVDTAATGLTAKATVATLALADGMAAFRRGDFETSSNHLRRAVKHYTTRGARADALRVLGQSQQALGRYEDSAAILRQALTLAEQSGDPVRVAAALGSLGNTLATSGARESAEALLKRGIALAERAGQRQVAARIFNNLGNQYVVRGALDEGLGAYEQGARLAAEAGARSAAAKTLANAARAALEAGKGTRGRTLLEQSEQHVQALAGSHDKATVLIHLANTHIRASTSPGASGEHLLKAHDHLQAAAVLGEALDDKRTWSYALGNLGALYKREGRIDEALYFTRRALDVADTASAADIAYRWHWQQGQLLWSGGDFPQAIAAYRRAVALLEQTRQDSIARYGSSAGHFRDLIAPVYLDLVDALLKASDRVGEQTQAHSLLLEARHTAERFKTAELRNYFHDQCVVDFEAKQRDLDAVAPNAAVVYPIVLPERLELLVSLRSGLSRYTVPVSAKRVTHTTRAFRQQLEDEARHDALLPAARTLYDWLVRPYADKLAQAGIDTLVFVPDGALRTIPMAALHDGERFLINAYAVAVTPSLTLTDPQPLGTAGAKLLLAGLSKGVQGFEPLENVPEELDAIHRLYGGDVLLDRDFTLERFASTLRDTELSIVHIASHAEFTGEADSSFLLAYDGRISVDRLNDFVGVAKFRDTPLELLVLSACETAAGDDRAALGLAGAGIKAGARSALGSLWSISDEAAFELIVEFYRQLKDPEGISKAVALQRAQQKLLDGGDFDHPFYWSSFLLVNDWL